MKYLKIFAIMLGAFAFASCSDKEEKHDINTAADVTVSMANATVKFKENKGLVNVPVKVTGTSNGYITVTCVVEEASDNPAMEDVHYLITSKTVTIEPEAESAYFEFSLVDDKEMNESRFFTVTLVSADGAKIGDPKQTLVELQDNDSKPYERIGGEWQIVTTGGIKGTAVFVGADEGEPGYNEYYMVEGLTGENGQIKATFSYASDTKTATLTFTYGETTLNLSGTDYDAYFCYLDDGYIKPDGTLVFSWSEDEDPDEIKFVSGPQETANFAMVYYDGGWYLNGQTNNVVSFHKQ